MTKQPPKLFISYSYDSLDHEYWVRNLATRLRENGVDVILDKWHFPLGKPSAMAMNNAVAISDRVLCICTDRYIKRVNEGKGGAGYEGCLITAELVKDSSTDKFIPAIRNITGTDQMPMCLDGRNRVNLSDGDRYEGELERLLRDLHRAIEIPPLGPNPFLTVSPKVISGKEVLESGDKKSASHGLFEKAKELLNEAGKDPNGRIFCYRMDQGTIFIINKQEFRSDDSRVQAAWESGFEELEKHGLIKAEGSNRIAFKLTLKGYEFLDAIKSE